ncbi:MAG: HD domain-containing protein, partial [Bacteroides sp.]|nr:HD domain-containing protein [Bacteroides sp.]
SDASSDYRYRERQSIITQHISSIMGVPILGKEGILGVIYVDSFSLARSFNKKNLELLSAIGHQAGIAIERFQLIERLENLFIGAIRTLVAAVDAKDRYTHGHSERVTIYSLALCDVLGVSKHERDIVELAGLLHDVGKIGVPESVLNKPDRLDNTEFGIIKQHPASGASIIRNIEHEYIDEVSFAIRAHQD